MKVLMSLAMYGCLPLIAHVTCVPEPFGTRVNCTELSQANGLVIFSRMDTASFGTSASTEQSPAQLLSENTYSWPGPASGPENSRFMVGSFSNGDQVVKALRLLISGKIFSAGALIVVLRW